MCFEYNIIKFYFINLYDKMKENVMTFNVRVYLHI